MGRYTDLFNHTESHEEVFTPTPVIESVEVSEPTVVEETEVFNPDAKDGDGDGIIQEGTPFERPVSQRKTRKKK
jgi:hypothetical protein